MRYEDNKVDMMKIDTKDCFEINDIVMKGSITADIKDDIIQLNKGCFYRFAEVPLKLVKKMVCDGNQIVKNGKVLITCKKCDGCPMCKKVELHVPLINAGSFRREYGYYCGQNDTYADDIKKLKKSKVKSKHGIELQKGYEGLKEHYKRKREKFITDDTVKRVVDSINSCLDTQYGTYNEYGHEVKMLEKIRIYENDYGYVINHDGRLGDDGWSCSHYVLKKCNIKEVERQLRTRYGRHVVSDL